MEDMKIIDGHTHIASWPTLKESEEALIQSMDEYGVEFSLISSVDAAEFPSVGESSWPNKSSLEALEDVLALCKKKPLSFGAALWFRVHDEDGPSEQLRECVKRNRKYIYALKFHPWDEKARISDPCCQKWIEYARELGLPILVHTAEDEYSDVAYLEEVARKNPDLRFVAAHMQLISDNHKAFEVMKRTSNVYADTAWVKMDMAKKVLNEIGKDRIFFGSDNPVDGVKTLSNPMYVEYFENKAGLSEGLYRKLMRENCIRFYHLPFAN